MSSSSFHLHLVDIEIGGGTVSVNDVVKATPQKLVDGAKSGKGKIIHIFKIVGENRLIAIFDGGVEAAIATLNASYAGNSFKVTCTPLRTYEQFAADVLNLDEYKSLPPPTHSLGNASRLYWLQFDVGFKGRTFRELMAVWSREAISDLSMRQSGKLEIDMYKTVAQNQVHAFINGQDEEILDDFIFTRPAMTEIGDEVHIVPKSLIQVYSSASK